MRNTRLHSRPSDNSKWPPHTKQVIECNLGTKFAPIFCSFLSSSMLNGTNLWNRTAHSAFGCIDSSCSISCSNCLAQTRANAIFDDGIFADDFMTIVFFSVDLFIFILETTAILWTFLCFVHSPHFLITTEPNRFYSMLTAELCCYPNNKLHRHHGNRQHLVIPLKVVLVSLVQRDTVSIFSSLSDFCVSFSLVWLFCYIFGKQCNDFWDSFEHAILSGVNVQ